MNLLGRIGVVAFRALAPIIWVEDKILTVLLGPKVHPGDVYSDR